MLLNKINLQNTKLKTFVNAADNIVLRVCAGKLRNIMYTIIYLTGNIKTRILSFIVRNKYAAI